MKRRAWLAGSLAPWALYGLAGCASRPPAPGPSWTGRLGLNLATDPPQSFFAGVELRGQASDGELVLLSPLGSTLATLVWAPGSATLHTAQGVQAFDSLETLTTAVTGTAVPVPALFDWLAGRNTTVRGWQADLSQQAQGRIIARRQEPAPSAELRLILEH